MIQSARRHRALGGIWIGLVADCRHGTMIERHVDGHCAQEFTLGIEDLNAPVDTIRHVDVALRVGCDAVPRIELSRL